MARINQRKTVHRAASSPPAFFMRPVQQAFLPSTHPGEVRLPVSSWQRRQRDPGVGTPLLNPCHLRCWRSCKSHKWRQSNTGRTGFGQMSYRRDNPAKTNIGKFHIFVFFAQEFVSVTTESLHFQPLVLLSVAVLRLSW